MSPKEMNKEQLVAKQAELEKLKADLTAKKKAKTGWTPEMQEQLDNVVMEIVDVQEAIKALGTSEEEDPKNPPYTPAEDQKNCVHARLTAATKYDPNTGKPLAKPFIQLFSRAEWNVFKDHWKQAGYSEVEVLYNPFEK